MQGATPLETVLRRDRAVVTAGVLAVAGLAWAYIVYLASSNNAMDMTMPRLSSWTATDFGLMFLMWSVMMIAMMAPTAAPMILVFATVNRRFRQQQRPFASTSIFVSGYLLVWCGFAVVATVGNWALHFNSLLNSMMGESTSAYLGGSLLMAAGAFQWSRLKYVCLTHCRTPMSFLTNSWREGNWGALAMGLQHGAYCVGCCWVIMGLLFVLGVMNLLWIAALAGFVLLEKVAPRGILLSRATGLGLAGWGVLMVAGVIR